MAKHVGEVSTTFDPTISEWGNPIMSNYDDPVFDRRGTGGTEISQYPEEKKTNAISLVATSEKESAQTLNLLGGLQDSNVGFSQVIRTRLERLAIEGDSPVF